MLNIDAFAYCRNGEQQTGKLPLSKLARLSAECISDEGEIEWALSGEMSERLPGYPALHLSINGLVQLKCQRCLTAYAFQIKSDSTMLIAKDEHLADQLESLLHDDESDDGKSELSSAAEVIVGSRTLDVIALIEDEALLALPLAPKHDVCPNDVLDVSAKVKKASPFAVLKDQLVVGKRKNSR